MTTEEKLERTKAALQCIVWRYESEAAYESDDMLRWRQLSLAMWSDAKDALRDCGIDIGPVPDDWPLARRRR